MNKKFFVLVFCLVFLFSVFAISAFQGSSTNYNSSNKVDSVTKTNVSSTSFTERFIGGIAYIGEYLVNLMSGRFGILQKDTDINLSINVTFPLNEGDVPRGNDAVAGEDDKGVVPDAINFTAKVYEDGTDSGFLGAMCYFYESDVLIGNSSTNSSGHCMTNFTRDSLSVGTRNLTVNYSIISSDVLVVENYSINYSIVRYVTALDMLQLRNNGRYYHGDTAILNITINKINQSGTFVYDPQNISANATNAAEKVYSGGDKFYPGGGIERMGIGKYTTNVSANHSFGAQLRWDVWLSNDGFASYVGSAVHSDKEICLADFGAWSDWSACVSGVQTRTRIDSSSCSEVETQSCGGGGGGGGPPCVPSWSDWGEWGDCLNNEQIRSRSDGCGSTEREFRPCECEPDWQCSEWGDCIGNTQKRTCVDVNGCGIDSGKPEEIMLCRDCEPEFTCEQWSECNVNYDIQDILKGKVGFEGSQRRECIDYTNCAESKIEWKSCSLASPVRINKVKWCYEDYIEIYEISSNKLVSRVKETSLEVVRRLDIDFVITDFEGYCGYCFDGVQNYDEEDVDCGGSGCPECVVRKTYVDYFYYLKWSLWWLLGLLIIFLVIKRIKEEKKKRKGKWFLFGKRRRKVAKKREFKRLKFPSIKIGKMTVEKNLKRVRRRRRK